MAPKAKKSKLKAKTFGTKKNAAHIDGVTRSKAKGA